MVGLSTLSPAQQGHAAMLVFSALVAGSFSLGGLSAPLIDPSVLMTLRFALATCVMAAVVLITGGFQRRALTAIWRYFVLGSLLACYFVLMFEGLQTAAPVSAAAVFTLSPIMAAGFGWLVMRQVLTLRMSLALGLGGTGAMWVIFRADVGALRAFDLGRGEAIYAVGCAAHALYAPLSRRWNRGEPTAVYTTGIVAAGTVVLLVYTFPALIVTEWAAVPAIVWITLAYLVVFATAASFMALQFAILRLPSAKVMAYTYLTPSWVILWEAALGNALPPALVMGGVGLTILALFLLLKEEAPAVPVPKIVQKPLG
jgi:drug/metabolite transporter (DMT)-like permease